MKRGHAGHSMSGRWRGFRGAPLLLAGLLILSTMSAAYLGVSPPESELEEDAINSLRFLQGQPQRSLGVIDVPSWRLGDEWTYDGYFNVAGLIASGGVSSNVQTLTGDMVSVLDSIDIETVENRSSLVYTLESVGEFEANGIMLDGYNGDLSVDYLGIEKFRSSDFSLISRSMSLEVNFLAFGIFNIDVADITILTSYSPPLEIYDFPIAVGESWESDYTVTVQWSGSSDYIDLPEDQTTQSNSSHSVVGVGDPGVSYTGCAGAYNITTINSSGQISDFVWYCPQVEGDAWRHFEQDIGLIMDFKLTEYSPSPVSRVITVSPAFPAWMPDGDLGVWINVTDAGGIPIFGQSVQFRYEAESDIRTLTTASNGSTYAIFDTGHFTDPSPTTFDYASHGMIGWIASSNQIGVSTLTLDENLVQVDIATSADGVSVTRERGGTSVLLTPITGFNAIPGDSLTFSVPVINNGILSSPATELEVTAPDGSTSRTSVPELPPRGSIRIDVTWTVSGGQQVGVVGIDFEADPDTLITNDENRSNNNDTFEIFIGRLPSAIMGNVGPTQTFTTILLDASGSSDPDDSADPDGGGVVCTFAIEKEDGNTEIVEQADCILEWDWSDDGTYTVAVIVTDDENDASNTSQDILIINRAALVNVGSNVDSVMVGEEVTFNAHDHYDIDTSTPEAPIAILWDAECDEGRVTLTCTIRPEIEGIYTMQLTAVDDDGAVTIASKSIDVTNIGPYDAFITATDNESGAELVMDSQMVWNIDEDQSIDLMGHASDSPNDMPNLRWEWQPDIDVDPNWHEVYTGESSSVTATYTEEGLHIIAMEVFDDDEWSTGVVNGWVRVHNVPPTIEPFDENSMPPVWEDSEASITGVYSDTPSDIDTLVACWDLDPYMNSDSEGSADDDCDINGAYLSRSWPVAGVYRVIFHVTDNDGEIVTQKVNISVANKAPKAHINASTLEPIVGSDFLITAEGSTDTPSDVNLLRYLWDLDTEVDSDDDGYPANDIDATGFEIWISFEKSGYHSVRLMVSDEASTDTADLTFYAQENETGLFSFLSGGGGGATTAIVILGLLFVVLLLVLGLTMVRNRRAEEGEQEMWQSPIPTFDIGESPIEAPPSEMFTAGLSPDAPPIPAVGLPEGWSVEQWNHYGHQWLAQEAEQAAASSVNLPNMDASAAFDSLGAASPADGSLTPTEPNPTVAIESPVKTDDVDPWEFDL